MTDARVPSSSHRDPRLTVLGILAAVTLVSVLLATLALWRQAALVAPHNTPETFFPGLSVKMRHVSRIRIVSKANGAFDVTFVPDKGWVLPAMQDYPADFRQVRTLLVGLAGLETIRPETGRADWLHYLDLGDPTKGGKGVAISLLDEKDHTIAALIVGKVRDLGGANGGEGLFVRRPGSKQSWLTRSVFEPKPYPNDWLNKTLLSVDRSRIEETDITPVSGPAYVVRRTKPSEPDFELVNMPKGRQLAYPDAPDDVAAAVDGFSFDKVARASQFDFAKAAQIVTKTFDGLEVTIAVIQKDTDYWATVSASADNDSAKKEARGIDARAAGWAYHIPAYKGAQFMTTLDSLLKRVAAKAKPRRQGK